MAPEGVKLGVKSLNALLVELRARIRDVARAVVGQQLAQRRKKSGKITSPLYLLTSHKKMQNTCTTNCFNFQVNW